VGPFFEQDLEKRLYYCTFFKILNCGIGSIDLKYPYKIAIVQTPGDILEDL
jgi:hypothetical protein